MKKTSKILITLCMIGVISILFGVYLSNSKSNLTKENAKDQALNIILENNQIEAKEVEFIEKTKNGNYKFLNKKTSKNRLTEYFIVDINTNSYEIESKIIKGDTSVNDPSIK